MDYTMHTFLEQLGLSRNERKVYEAALMLGESTAAQIASSAKVHRVATYALIDNLIKKGLLTKTQARRGARISPLHPREIRTLLAKEQRHLKKLELQYERVLPELTSLFQHASTLPRVQFFEGIKGLRAINTDIIETMRECAPESRVIYSYANPNMVVDVFAEYVDGKSGFIEMRKTFEIWNKVIALDGTVTRTIQKRDEEELREMVILSEAAFPFHNDITLYGNKMAIQALEKDLIGVIIESKDIVRDQYAIFQLAWEGAKHIQDT